MSDRRDDAEQTDPNDAHAALGLPRGVTLEPLDDDEPTEPEIEAARQAYWNERRALSNTGLDTWTGDDSAWAAALLAARKARP